MDLQKFKEEIQKQLGATALKGPVTGLVVSLVITEEELVEGLGSDNVFDMVEAIQKKMQTRNLKAAYISDIAGIPEPKGMHRITAWVHVGN